MSRLFERLGAGETALGVWIKGGPTWVSTIARAGFDFVRPDMMFSSLDWGELHNIHRAAQVAGLTTWVRVPANPWLSGTEQLQVTVEVQRAFAIGIEIVGASIASAAQARACLQVAGDWHRSGAGEYPNSNETFKAMHSKQADAAVFVPHIEAGTAVHEIDEILALDGMRILMLAMTDLSKALGHPFQYEHPDVWRHVDTIVAKAQARGIVIAANMGYDYTTHERMTARVKRMHDHGIRICLMQGADNMLENFAKPMLGDIRTATA
ncbi:MAG TPA: aldolase/citrate lyase family protein [Burkholderiales bacterium]|jgi:2-keto-3-deoxy-L-rhamnonate aldolase RhmA|nr:aldolase/citrate lyase family protein [Burkholderiales bacterium]